MHIFHFLFLLSGERCGDIISGSSYRNNVAASLGGGGG